MDFLNKQIIFPTDFSDNAKRALPFAAEIASQADARLILFHASQEPMYLAPDFEKRRKEMVQKADRHFDELVDGLREDERFESLDISTRLQLGQPVTSLLEFLKETEPGLVVMGTKGATGGRNVLFGSVTTRVIQKSDIPILTIPNVSTFDNFDDITFATDFKESDLEVLRQLTSLARLFDSTINVLHVDEHVGEEPSLSDEIKFRGFRDLVADKIDYEKINFHHKHEHDFFPGAADYIAKHKTSLFAMVRYKKTFWEAFAEGQHSKEMAFYSTVPLMVFTGN